MITSRAIPRGSAEKTTWEPTGFLVSSLSWTVSDHGSEQTGRICYAVELDPKYVDVIIRRWQAFTGKQAVLDGDGRTFDEIAEERSVAV